MKKYVKIKAFVNHNQYMKSDKMPCTIYADLESLIKQSRKVFNNQIR